MLLSGIATYAIGSRVAVKGSTKVVVEVSEGVLDQYMAISCVPKSV